MGACVGTLTPSAATHLGLTAYYGMDNTKTTSDKCSKDSSIKDSDSQASDTKAIDTVGASQDDNPAGKSHDDISTNSPPLSLQGLKVIQGGPDAYVGMLGLGCVQGGQLALVTGSR